MSRALLPVMVGDVPLALDALEVREILGRRAWVPLPGTRPHLPGVVGWNGRAIAVLDLGAALAAAPPLQRGDVRERLVVAQAGGCTVALPVHAVREVQEVSGYRLQPLQVSGQQFAAGEVELEGRPVAVVDLARLIASLVGTVETASGAPS